MRTTKLYTQPKGTNKLLLLETELLNQSVVALLVLALEVLKVRAAVGHHLQKAAAAVLVLKCFFKCEVSSSICLDKSATWTSGSRCPCRGLPFL
jgi:hypothetical protein